MSSTSPETPTREEEPTPTAAESTAKTADATETSTPVLPDEDLPPLRMHATRVPQRLSGSKLVIPPNLAKVLRRQQEEESRSGSRSPATATGRHRRSGSGSGKGTAGTTTSATASTVLDANSSISSLEEVVDLDILTDRAGLEELDLNESQRKMHASREGFNLPSVNERMSEEALEDVHAFSDVVRSSNCSRANSSAGGAILEPLDELCENEMDEDDLDDIPEENEQAVIVLTNMENLSMEDDDPNDVHTRSTRGTDSLLEEAPSAPTA